MTDITQVSGIGPAAAGLLRASGFNSAEDLATATVESLAAVKGFGPARATTIITAAQQLLASVPAVESAAKSAKKPKKQDEEKAKKKAKKADKEKPKSDKKKDKKTKKKKK